MTSADYIIEKTKKRWFKFPDKVINHPIHKAWRNSKTRFNVIPGPRRCYKSEQAKRKLYIGDTYHPGALQVVGNYIYAAPTFKQVKKLAWNDLKDLGRPYFSKKPNESELTIYLQNGSEIWLVGLDNAERAEGPMIGGGIVDETGNTKEDFWTHHLQPVTADNDGWWDFIGVPEGKNHYYDMHNYRLTNDNWDSFTWKASEMLPADVIEEAKRTLPLKAFQQEYEASFDISETNVYYAYSEKNHLQKEFNPLLKTYLCFDFNVNPMSCIVVQEIIKDSKVAHCAVIEFVYPSNTKNFAIDIHEWLQENNFDSILRITGDYSGISRKTSSDYTDYIILEGIFKNYKGFGIDIGRTDRIKKRTNAMNALFCNTLDEISFYINKDKCPELHKDLLKVQWDGNDLKGFTHPSDACSYFALNYYPITSGRIEIL